MGTIFWASAKNISWVGARYFLIGIAFGLLSAKLGFHEVAVFSCVASGMALLQTSNETGRRLPFFLSLPISRERLVFLVGAINYFGFLLFSLLAILHVTIVEYFFIIVPHISAATSITDAIADPVRSEPDIPWMILYAVLQVVFTLGVWAFFIAVDPSVMKKMSATSSPITNGIRWKELRSMGIAAVSILILGTLAMKSTFIMCSFALLGISAASIHVVARAWVFTRKRTFRWGACIFAFTALQVLSIYIFARAQQRKPEVGAQLAAARFLWVAEPSLSSAFLRMLFAKPMRVSDAEELTGLLARETRNSKFPISRFYSDISLREVIPLQRSPEVLAKLIPLFDPARISKQDFTAMLETGDSIAAQEIWITASLPPSLVAPLLSKVGKHTSFALRYAQFHPQQEYLGPVRLGLAKTYPAELIPTALLTLSLLEGTKFDLRSYMNRAPASRSSRIKLEVCAETHFVELIATPDEFHFNRCVRLKIASQQRHPELVRRLSSWKTLPISAADARFLRKADSDDVAP